MSNKAISIFGRGTKEYKRLQAAAMLIEAETNKKCKVETIYFDIGQDWLWTTISIESGMESFPYVQALNPKQQNDIIYGDIKQWSETVNCVIEKNK